MTAKNDSGVHRHLVFRSIGRHPCLHWFELVTWPGSLAINGDMGTYQFSRIVDMFEFFRRPGGGINPSYWSEKLDSVDRQGAVRMFDRAAARAKLAEEVAEWSPDAKREAFSEIGAAIDDSDADGQRFREACERFEFNDPGSVARGDDDWGEWPPRKYEFVDVWEWGTGSVYTPRFLWCLRAIVWGIAQYDAAKQPAAVGATA